MNLLAVLWDSGGELAVTPVTKQTTWDLFSWPHGLCCPSYQHDSGCLITSQRHLASRKFDNAFQTSGTANSWATNQKLKGTGQGTETELDLVS